MTSPWSPRLAWSHLPDPVRSWTEDVLGSPVTEAVNADGGMSPGLAARVRTDAGTRAFVKAVGDTLNPDTPALHRREAQVCASLPARAPAPALRAVYDDGGWVALVFDEVRGRMPAAPWNPTELAAVAGGLTDLATILTPAPEDSAGLGTVRQQLDRDFTAYTRLRHDVPGDLHSWEHRHLAALDDLSRSALGNIDGDTLVHLDMRADNVLLDEDSAVWFVVWPWASRGAAWIDSVLLLIDIAAGGDDPEPHLARNPLTRDVDPGHITGFLAGLAGMWAESSRQPDPPGLPTIRAFQRRQHSAVLPWLRRRTGWA